MGQRAAAAPREARLVDGMVASAANYRAALAGDLVAALAFLAFGLHRFAGPPSEAGGVVLAGVLSFTFLEYAVHRWVLHGPSSPARRGHAHHHAAPTALVSTPFFVIMLAALAVWSLLRLACSAGADALLVFGLYAGYNYFAWFHHWEHHHRAGAARVAYWQRLDRLHHLHHQQPGVNFGISTTIWDRLFGTFQSESRRTSRDSRR